MRDVQVVQYPGDDEVHQIAHGLNAVVPTG